MTWFSGKSLQSIMFFAHAYKLCVDLHDVQLTSTLSSLSLSEEEPSGSRVLALYILLFVTGILVLQVC